MRHLRIFMLAMLTIGVCTFGPVPVRASGEEPSSPAADELQANVAAPEEIKPQRLPQELEGKLLVISVRENPHMGATLQDVRFEEFAGRGFLVGRHVDLGQPGEWRQGRLVWIAAEEVLQIVVFEDVTLLQEAWAR